MTRTDVTEMVVMAKIKKGLSWPKIAKAVGQSKEWTTAALLGQMQMTKPQAETAGSRIKLEIATADLITIWPHLGIGFINLFHNRNMASRLILPVVPNTY